MGCLRGGWHGGPEEGDNGIGVLDRLVRTEEMDGWNAAGGVINTGLTFRKCRQGTLRLPAGELGPVPERGVMLSEDPSH